MEHPMRPASPEKQQLLALDVSAPSPVEGDEGMASSEILEYCRPPLAPSPQKAPLAPPRTKSRMSLVPPPAADTGADQPFGRSMSSAGADFAAAAMVHVGGTSSQMSELVQRPQLMMAPRAKSTILLRRPSEIEGTARAGLPMNPGRLA